MHNFSLAWQLLVDNICVLQMPGLEISHVNELSFYTVAMELTRVLHALISTKTAAYPATPIRPSLTQNGNGVGLEQ